MMQKKRRFISLFPRVLIFQSTVPSNGVRYPLVGGMGVTVTVSVAVGDSVGVGVIVEIAITLFPILQLARTKKDHTKSKNFFAMMTTSAIVSLLSLYLNIPTPNGWRYPSR
jgi:hypothetical protein